MEDELILITEEIVVSDNENERQDEPIFTSLKQPSGSKNVDQEVDGSKGLVENLQNKVSRLREVRVSPEDLEKNMRSFLRMVGRLFEQADTVIGQEADLRLDEVQLSVEISAKAEVKLVAGGETTGKGAIMLKFKRPTSK
jgi:hypothetical protein